MLEYSFDRLWSTEKTFHLVWAAQLDHSTLQRESILVPTTDSVDAATGLPAESYPQGYLERVKKFAPLLAKVRY